MILVPAVDLLEGQVVRLIEGDFERKTVFAERPPVELLNGFVGQGAQLLHLVDLSGARDPAHRQHALVESIVRGVPADVQIGGGIRDLTEIEQLLNLGAARVVLGSMIVSDPKASLAALEKFGPDRLTFALDVRLEESKAMVMSHGWKTATGQTLQAVIQPYLAAGLKRVLCTDIARDGRMLGPNLKLYRALVETFSTLEIQASGGVSNLGDLASLKDSGVQSVVIGRALLSGAIDLTEAFQHVK